MDSSFVAANFLKKESRSPRGFLPRPLLRAGESVAPPPYPQKNSGGAHQEFRSKKVRANARITPQIKAPKGVFLFVDPKQSVALRQDSNGLSVTQ